jgi:integrase
MSDSQVRDYTSILNTHLLPYFGDLAFAEFWPVLMKKFFAFLRTKQTPQGTPLSPKRIHNILIPLRVIFKDAYGEYDWNDLPESFSDLRLPKVQRIRIQPFTFKEWEILKGFIPVWYRSYFEFAVSTGLRPSEQVALKWDAIDETFIHIELSRVRNLEKPDLKTTGSNRRIEILQPLRDLLEEQQKLVAGYQSPYVFLNTKGRPVNQVSVRQVWVTALRKSGLPFRRMYENRHTFASWALSAGESVEWVARALGHTTTAMVYKTYGRYIPNFTRQYGSALERLLAGKKEGNRLGTIIGTMARYPVAEND